MLIQLIMNLTKVADADGRIELDGAAIAVSDCVTVTLKQNAEASPINLTIINQSQGKVLTNKYGERVMIVITAYMHFSSFPCDQVDCIHVSDIATRGFAYPYLGHVRKIVGKHCQFSADCVNVLRWPDTAYPDKVRELTIVMALISAEELQFMLTQMPLLRKLELIRSDQKEANANWQKVANLDLTQLDEIHLDMIGGCRFWAIKMRPICLTINHAIQLAICSIDASRMKEYSGPPYWELIDQLVDPVKISMLLNHEVEPDSVRTKRFMTELAKREYLWKNPNMQVAINNYQGFENDFVPPCPAEFELKITGQQFGGEFECFKALSVRGIRFCVEQLRRASNLVKLTCDFSDLKLLGSARISELEEANAVHPTFVSDFMKIKPGKLRRSNLKMFRDQM